MGVYQLLGYLGALSLMFFLGGTIGYLIGSRRFRKKGEDLLRESFNVVQILETQHRIPSTGDAPKGLEYAARTLDRRFGALKFKLIAPGQVDGASRRTDRQISISRLDPETPTEEPNRVKESVMDQRDWKNYSAVYLSVPEISTEQQKAAPALDQKFLELYNRGISEMRLRDAFWDDFDPLQIDNANAVDQTVGNASEPEFRTSGNGVFYAVPEDASGCFLVVPVFDTTIKAANYQTTLRHVFDCGEFDPSADYSRFRIDRPARLRCISNDTWTVIEKGAITLLG